MTKIDWEASWRVGELAREPNGRPPMLLVDARHFTWRVEAPPLAKWRRADFVAACKRPPPSTGGSQWLVELGPDNVLASG